MPEVLTAHHPAPVEHPAPETPPARGARPEFLKTLPIAEHESEIKQLLWNHDRVIIVGQTGSGKSIVLPEFILDVISNNGQDKSAKMIVTQPRQLAVDNVVDSLNRLGKEKIGVRYKGYQGDQHVSETTNIDVMVAGSLLNVLVDGLKKDALGNQTLCQPYRAILIDEVHEESVDSHLNRILAKKVQALRKEKGMPSLQIDLTSGSVDVPKLKQNFPGAMDIEIPGRAFPVTDHFSTEEIAYEDMPIEAAKRALDILADPTKDGNILAIMPGRSDIAATITEFNKQLQSRGDIPNKDNIEVIPITGGDVDRAQQLKALEKSSKRRFFVGTPVVEASVTIDNLKHMIDSGKKKINIYDPVTGLSRLTLVDHTKANKKQRQGRAGRVAPGNALYLYTKEQFDKRDDFPKPEIMHVDLAPLVLRMKQIGIEDIYEFDYEDKPDKDSLDAAVLTLQQLGALDRAGKITPIGKEMAEIPVDPHYSRMLIEAKKQGCPNAVAILVGFLSNQQSVYSFNSREISFNQKYDRFLSKESDYITFLKAWNGYVENTSNQDRNQAREWAKRNGLNNNVLYEIGKTKNELLSEDFARELGISPLHAVIDTKNKDLVNAIGKCITAGFADRMLAHTEKGVYKGVTKKINGVQIGNNSSLAGSIPALLVADGIKVVGKEGRRQTIAEKCQVVQEGWLHEVAPYLEELGLVEKAPEVQKAVSQAKEALHAEVAKVTSTETKAEDSVKQQTEVKLSFYGKTKQALKTYFVRIRQLLGL